MELNLIGCKFDLFSIISYNLLRFACLFISDNLFLLTDNQRNALDRAIQEYKDKTCIRFINRNSNENKKNEMKQENYINFINDNGGCWSYVGMNGGVQEVCIFCMYCI